jgi:hypothetical protein
MEFVNCIVETGKAKPFSKQDKTAFSRQTYFLDKNIGLGQKLLSKK